MKNLRCFEPFPDRAHGLARPYGPARHGMMGRPSPFNRAHAVPGPRQQPVGWAQHDPWLKHVGSWPV
jgi:hypothetical protein